MTGFFEDHLNLDTVVAYADGELSLVAFQRAASHVMRCARCAAEVDEQMSARACLRSAADPVMPSSLTAALCSIPLAVPAAGPSRGVAMDVVTGHAIRVSHIGRDVTRTRRIRLGAGALVAGIAVGAFATAAAPADEPSVIPIPRPAVVPAVHVSADMSTNSPSAPVPER